MNILALGWSLFTGFLFGFDPTSTVYCCSQGTSCMSVPKVKKQTVDEQAFFFRAPTVFLWTSCSHAQLRFFKPNLKVLGPRCLSLSILFVLCVVYCLKQLFQNNMTVSVLGVRLYDGCISMFFICRGQIFT